MSSKPTLRMDWATHAAAKYAVERWHYSRTMPVGKSVKIGAWEDGKFIGVFVFSWGASPWLAGSIGLQQVECAELVRAAFTAHSTKVTRMLAIAIRMLRKQSPGLRALVSFADANKGHHGGIYQGGGWTYIGRTKDDFVYEHKGKELHKRAYSGNQFGKPGSKAQLPKSAIKVARAGKHKYVLGLTAADRARFAELAKPYPKRSRAGSADSGTPDVQSGRGGADPTPAL